MFEPHLWDPETRTFRPASETRPRLQKVRTSTPTSEWHRKVLLGLTLATAVLATGLIVALLVIGEPATQYAHETVPPKGAEPLPLSGGRVSSVRQPASPPAGKSGVSKWQRGKISELVISIEPSLISLRPLGPLQAEVVADNRRVPLETSGSPLLVTFAGEEWSPRASGEPRVASSVRLPRSDALRLLARLGNEGVALDSKGMAAQEVSLAATVTASGVISAVERRHGAPTLAQAAVETVKRARIQPLRQKGKAVDTQALVRVRFLLSAR